MDKMDLGSSLGVTPQGRPSSPFPLQYLSFCVYICFELPTGNCHVNR